jgi:hypothetical protein
MLGYRTRYPLDGVMPMELPDERCPIGGDIWCGGINAVPIKTAVMGFRTLHMFSVPL